MSARLTICSKVGRARCAACLDLQMHYIWYSECCKYAILRVLILTYCDGSSACKKTHVYIMTAVEMH